MRRCLFALFTLFTFFTVEAVYERPASITPEQWERLKSYLLPENMPVKEVLDKIFSERVTSDYHAFERAGFMYKDRLTRKRLIAKHHKIPDYLIKTYLDVHSLAKPDWMYWKHRIDGARKVQKTIDKRGYQHIMKVPGKWLYPLPAKPASKEAYPITCILVVEDMHVYHDKRNKEKYRELMNKERMDALYTVLKENKMWDSIHIFNIPFSNDGKIAFIDTEIFNSNSRPVRFSRMTKFMPPKLQGYWKHISKGK